MTNFDKLILEHLVLKLWVYFDYQSVPCPTNQENSSKHFN